MNSLLEKATDDGRDAVAVAFRVSDGKVEAVLRRPDPPWALDLATDLAGR